MACGVVLFTLALTSATQLGLIAPSPSASEIRAAQSATALRSRVLRVCRWRQGHRGRHRCDQRRYRACLSASEGSGFIRGVLRGMGRDRHRRGRSRWMTPYELNHWSDGSLSLTDTATNRIVELGAFGPDQPRHLRSAAQVMGLLREPCVRHAVPHRGGAERGAFPCACRAGRRYRDPARRQGARARCADHRGLWRKQF